MDAWKAMVELLTNPKKADHAYDQLPESRNGRIISTDIARHLDEKYANALSIKQRDLEPGWDLAWRYAQDRFFRELRKKAKRRTIRMMAGGWAAGKTHALENFDAPDLAWDGTLKDLEWAVSMVDHALTCGWKIEIAYVFRDIELAFYGAVERANKEGRLVPLTELPHNHRAVQKSIVKLAKLYETEQNVSFIMLHNLGTPNVPCSSQEISLFDLDTGGALHYTEPHEQYYTKVATQIGK